MIAFDGLHAFLNILQFLSFSLNQVLSTLSGLIPPSLFTGNDLPGASVPVQVSALEEDSI
ncbi:MAG: hypothetical protein H7254_15155 [Ferruginibacter sp.]|nr:hypothetical protein [Ferruginibacter sp.]